MTGRMVLDRLAPEYKSSFAFEPPSGKDGGPRAGITVRTKYGAGRIVCGTPLGDAVQPIQIELDLDVELVSDDRLFDERFTATAVATAPTKATLFHSIPIDRLGGSYVPRLGRGAGVAVEVQLYFGWKRAGDISGHLTEVLRQPGRMELVNIGGFGAI